MYLSRITLNTARRGTRLLLASPHAMHAAVMAAFPPDVALENADGRVLWRIDTVAPQKVDLLIASPEPPDLAHVVEQAGWPTRPEWDTRPYGPLLRRLERGQRWRFRLVGNPVRSVRDERGTERRKAHVTVAQQAMWLVDRAERHGFAIVEGAHGAPGVTVSDRMTRTFKRAGHVVTLVTARFDGMLEVTDPNAFRRALGHGLGHGKGYGCGMLTVAPVANDG